MKWEKMYCPTLFFFRLWPGVHLCIISNQSRTFWLTKKLQTSLLLTYARCVNVWVNMASLHDDFISSDQIVKKTSRNCKLSDSCQIIVPCLRYRSQALVSYTGHPTLLIHKGTSLGIQLPSLRWLILLILYLTSSS